MKTGCGSRVSVRLFGGLRSFAPEGLVEVELRGGMSVGEAKTEIARRLARSSRDAAEWVRLSALAREERVLRDDETLEAGFEEGRLALLPPVNGG